MNNNKNKYFHMVILGEAFYFTLQRQRIQPHVLLHPPIGTVGLSEPEAREKFGDDQVKVYKSSFTAVTQHRQPCRMKLVCVGADADKKSQRMLAFFMLSETSSS